MFWIYGVTKLSSRKIIADCEGTVVNGVLGLLCRGFASEIYGHVLTSCISYNIETHTTLLSDSDYYHRQGLLCPRP